MLASLHRRLLAHGENIVYRAAGLPITLAALAMPGDGSAAASLRRAYAGHYWSPGDPGEWFDLIAGSALVVPGLLLAALWFTWRNGAIVARRSGRSILAQFADQLRLFARCGILPPWYYIFSLHEPGARRQARSFLNRCETKRGVYRLLRTAFRSTSPLDDKIAFDERCRAHQLPVAPVVMAFHDGEAKGDEPLPCADLFAKPACGRGGRGAERWDHVAADRYRNLAGREMSAAALVERLRRKSRDRAWLIQRRLINHPAIADLGNGALSTVRALTCLDEHGRPELVAAVFRMAIGANRTVDNIHAGGIAAAVDLARGTLSDASDLGMDARLGWLDRYPETGGRITGRTLPLWGDLCELAVRAHRAFDDRIMIGWDIGLTVNGPCIVEGNSGPDVDLMQRPARRGLADGRFGELLAFHLARAAEAPHRRPAPAPARE
ncbi:MAG TPA: sugar-transfer associated ATP-grasp domain-containing protein [Sphingomonas sp.]|nr:sugar-transfer associated ATP-grasp domain-containing protein [Sphingomonas sp.]